MKYRLEILFENLLGIWWKKATQWFSNSLLLWTPKVSRSAIVEVLDGEVVINNENEIPREFTDSLPFF